MCVCTYVHTSVFCTYTPVPVTPVYVHVYPLICSACKCLCYLCLLCMYVHIPSSVCCDVHCTVLLIHYHSKCQTASDVFCLVRTYIRSRCICTHTDVCTYKDSHLVFVCMYIPLGWFLFHPTTCGLSYLCTGIGLALFQPRAHVSASIDFVRHKWFQNLIFVLLRVSSNLMALNAM